MDYLDLALALYRYTPSGGLERNGLVLAEAAARRGHRVRLYTRRFEGPKPAGLDVRELAVRAPTNIGRDRAFARALARALAEEPAELRVGFNRLPALDVFYAADPCLAATRAWSPLPNRRQRLAWERAAFAPEARTECLVSCAREAQRYSEHYGTPRERLHVLPPGLRPEFFAATPPRALELPPEALAVLAVGSDFRRKGLDRSLRALAALPDGLHERVWLFVLGRDPPEHFRTLAHRLGLGPRVRFVGVQEAPAPWLRAADLLLHPAREENTGNVLLEALSQGVPVIASGACGYAEHVTAAGAGHVLAEPFDADAFARALAAILGDASLRRTFGERGRRAARAWPLAARTDAALAVLESAAAQKRQHAESRA